MSEYAVHRCRLFEYTPRAIQCMSSHETITTEGIKVHELAVGREDGSVELMRSTITGFYTHMTIPGSSKRTLEDLVWCCGRLFSADLQGDITEYDVMKGTVKYSEDSYGGAVWCLAASDEVQIIAAGCEDGSIKIFDCDETRITYKKSMDKQEGRILSCSFHPSNEIIVSGSVDVIRIWSYKSGHAIRRIRLENSGHSGTIVWAVKMLSDHTIVSGDSKGRVQFWNGKNVTLIKSFHSHQADILSLCVSADETAVYAAGVDPKVLELNYIMNDESEAMKDIDEIPIPTHQTVGIWVKGATLQKHSHDVRSLVIIDNFLASGGVDTNILLRKLHNRKDRRVRRVLGFPDRSYVHLATSAEMLLFQYPNYLDIWRLAVPVSTTGSVGEEIALKKHPTKLIQIKCSPHEYEHIACSSISRCGHWVAYSTKTSFRLFRLNWKTSEPKDISLIKVRAVWFTPAMAITFTSDSTHMVTSSLDGSLKVIKLDADAHAHISHVFHDEAEADCMLPVHMLATYSIEYIATVDSANQIKVYDLKEYTVHCTLPNRNSAVTALSFKPDAAVLFVVYQDHEVAEYDVVAKSYTKWCREAHSAGFNLLNRQTMGEVVKCRPKWNAFPVFKISFPPCRPNTVMLTSNKAIYFVDQSVSLKKEVGENGKEGDAKEAVTCASDFQPLLYATAMDGGTSLLVVERGFAEVFNSLPPSLYQKKFGT